MYSRNVKFVVYVNLMLIGVNYNIKYGDQNGQNLFNKPFIWLLQQNLAMKGGHRDFNGFCIYKTRSFKFRRMTSCHPWALAWRWRPKCFKTSIPLIFKTKPWHVLKAGHRDFDGFIIYRTRSFKFRRMTSCHPWALASKMASKMADWII